MEASRIIVVDLPRLLREIIERTVGDQPDMEIVSELGSSTILGQALEATGADFVIAGPGCNLTTAAELLYQWPRLRLLAVTQQGREAFLYELCRMKRPLGEISPQMIVDAIRSDRCAS